MEIIVTSTRIAVTVPGHSWSTGAKPPAILGWRCFWVSHYGQERTVWSYRREAAS